MDKIKLNDILHLSEEDISKSKIELNMYDGSGGPQFIDEWLPLSAEEKYSGITECSYWPWQGKQRNFSIGQKVFSFVRMSNDRWLLISAAIILDLPMNRRASVSILTEYQPLFGRLIMKFHKGNAFSRYVFNLSYLGGREEIVEILPSMYDGEHFNGYDNINLPYSKLHNIFEGKLMPTYYEALKKITGIYCLTDTSNGKLYIGSATGEEGVAQRWGDYLSSKHGGNVKLKELYKNKGEKYFEKNFTFSLIEYFSLSYDPEKIRNREQYWKRCLDTIEHGYNNN